MKGINKILPIIAANSKCKRSQVGAIITRDGRILSTGWNGTPSKYSNECEENDTTNKSVVHAEANAILWAAREGLNTYGCTIHISMSPCFECAKMIVQSGIKKVVFIDRYRDEDPIRLLKSCGVEVVHEPSAPSD